MCQSSRCEINVLTLELVKWVTILLDLMLLVMYIVMISVSQLGLLQLESLKHILLVFAKWWKDKDSSRIYLIQISLGSEVGVIGINSVGSMQYAGDRKYFMTYFVLCNQLFTSHIFHVVWLHVHVRHIYVKCVAVWTHKFTQFPKMFLKKLCTICGGIDSAALSTAVGTLNSSNIWK